MLQGLRWEVEQLGARWKVLDLFVCQQTGKELQVPRPHGECEVERDVVHQKGLSVVCPFCSLFCTLSHILGFS